MGILQERRKDAGVSTLYLQSGDVVKLKVQPRGHAGTGRVGAGLILHLPLQSGHFIGLVSEDLCRWEGQTTSSTSILFLGGAEASSYHSTTSRCSSIRWKGEAILVVVAVVVATAAQCIQIGLGTVGIELKRGEWILFGASKCPLLLWFC
jgi:hypothetical protein